MKINTMNEVIFIARNLLIHLIQLMVSTSVKNQQVILFTKIISFLFNLTIYLITKKSFRSIDFEVKQ